MQHRPSVSPLLTPIFQDDEQDWNNAFENINVTYGDHRHQGYNDTLVAPRVHRDATVFRPESIQAFRILP
jgi:hypothetical protein